MNPYAHYLGDRNPAVVIGETPGRLRALAEKLGTAGLERATAPGKWTAREILCHLADVELGFGFRLRQALSEAHHVIQPFDQERWAVNYAAYDAGLALEVFSALRAWNLKLIGSLKPEEFAKPVTHPVRGQMTFGAMVETLAGHDLNHIAQLESIAAAA